RIRGPPAGPARPVAGRPRPGRSARHGLPTSRRNAPGRAPVTTSAPARLDHGRGRTGHSAATTAAETVADPRVQMVPPSADGGPETHVQPSTVPPAGRSEPAG